MLKFSYFRPETRNLTPDTTMSSHTFENLMEPAKSRGQTERKETP